MSSSIINFGSSLLLGAASVSATILLLEGPLESSRATVFGVSNGASPIIAQKDLDVATAEQVAVWQQVSAPSSGYGNTNRSGSRASLALKNSGSFVYVDQTKLDELEVFALQSFSETDHDGSSSGRFGAHGTRVGSADSVEETSVSGPLFDTTYTATGVRANESSEQVDTRLLIVYGPIESIEDGSINVLGQEFQSVDPLLSNRNSNGTVGQLAYIEAQAGESGYEATRIEFFDDYSVPGATTVYVYGGLDAADPLMGHAMVGDLTLDVTALEGDGFLTPTNQVAVPGVQPLSGGLILGYPNLSADENLLTALSTSKVLSISGSSIQGISGSSRNLRSISGSSRNLRSISGSSRNLRSISGSSRNLRSISGSSRNLRSISGSSRNLRSISGSSRNLQSISGSSRNLQSISGSSRNLRSISESSLR